MHITNFFSLLGGEHMSQVPKMTNRNPVDLYKVDGIFTSYFASIGIMEGGDADYKDTFDFIFAGAGNYLWVATYTLIISMGVMLMAHADNVSRRFAQ